MFDHATQFTHNTDYANLDVKFSDGKWIAVCNKNEANIISDFVKWSVHAGGFDLAVFEELVAILNVIDLCK